MRAFSLAEGSSGQHDRGFLNGAVQEGINGDDAGADSQSFADELLAGEVAHRVGSQTYEHSNFACCSLCNDAGGVATFLSRHTAPDAAIPIIVCAQRSAPWEQAWRKTHFQRAVHIASSQSRQKAGLRVCLGNLDGDRGNHIRRFRKRTAPEDDSQGRFIFLPQQLAQCRNIAHSRDAEFSVFRSA